MRIRQSRSGQKLGDLISTEAKLDHSRCFETGVRHGRRIVRLLSKLAMLPSRSGGSKASQVSIVFEGPVRSGQWIAKDFAYFGSGYPRLHVGNVQPSSERITQELAQHSHCSLPASLFFDRQSQIVKVTQAGSAGRIDQTSNGLNESAVIAELAEHAFSKWLDAVS